MNVTIPSQADTASAFWSRRHSLSRPTPHACKADYGDLQVSEAKQLRALEVENARLKRLIDEHTLNLSPERDVVWSRPRPLTGGDRTSRSAPSGYASARLGWPVIRCLLEPDLGVHRGAGRPAKKAHIESYNGRPRDKCLNAPLDSHACQRAACHHALSTYLTTRIVFEKSAPKLFPTRTIRGIIVAGRADDTAIDLLRTVTEFRIDLVVYEVRFSAIAGSAGSSSSV